MKIGEQVEVLYLGQWIPGTIKSLTRPSYEQNRVRMTEATAAGPLEVCGVETEKAYVAGVAVAYGTMRVPQGVKSA